MPSVISHVKNPVRWDPSETRDSFTVYGLGRIQGVFKGLGLLYFWIQRGAETASWGSQFALLQSTPAEYSMIEPEEATVILDARAKFPCSGVITGTQEGYIIAPTLKLDVPQGRDLVLMLLSPGTAPHEVSVDKSTLIIPGEDATVTLSTSSGELHCLGTVPGYGFKTARIVLNRNPGLPIYKAGFNQTLCELKGSGQISAVWKPVTRNFEQCVMALHPPILSSYSMTSFLPPPPYNDLAEHLGAPEDGFSGTMGDYVVGDGVGVNYTVRLVLDRGLGRHASDEARLLMS